MCGLIEFLVRPFFIFSRKYSAKTDANQAEIVKALRAMGCSKDGVFKLTEAGKEKCGYSEKNEAPKGASVVDEGATSSSINNSGETQTDKVTVDDFF